MTQPPLEPAGRGPAADPSPTETVPAFEPVPAVEPVAAAVESGPSPSRARTGSSTILTVAIAAAVLVAAVGIAFAAGRTSSAGTSPASYVTGGVPNRQQPWNPGGDADARGGHGGGADGRGGAPGLGGPGPMDGSDLPDAGLDLDGNGAFPGDLDGGADHAVPGRGFGHGGPGGFGGLGVSGTVTAVDEDSITIRTDAGLAVTLGLDGGTTYHLQAPAAASDVTAGDKVQVQLGDGVRPGRDADGNLSLGTAGDVTIVP